MRKRHSSRKYTKLFVPITGDAGPWREEAGSWLDGKSEPGLRKTGPWKYRLGGEATSSGSDAGSRGGVLRSGDGSLGRARLHAPGPATGDELPSAQQWEESASVATGRARSGCSIRLGATDRRRPEAVNASFLGGSLKIAEVGGTDVGVGSNHLGGATGDLPTVHEDRHSIGKTEDRVHVVFDEKDPGLFSRSVHDREEL